MFKPKRSHTPYILSQKANRECVPPKWGLYQEKAGHVIKEIWNPE